MNTIRKTNDKAMSKLGSVRNSLSRIRPKVDEVMANAKPKVAKTWQRVSTKTNELRRNPAVIGGVAGAAGLTLGLLGRWMRHRAHRAHAPTLVVIETCCSRHML